MMRRLLSFLVVLLASGVASLPLAAQQAGGLGLRRFPMSGTLRDAVTNEAPEDVLVELRVFNGSTVGQVFTSQNGKFDFGSMPADTYSLIVDRAGYERIDQQIYLTMSRTDIQLELHRKGVDPNAPTGPLVSVRELSIPRRAHDAMEKGMGLLYQKSDYPASLTQFQRAVKEYPAYYEAYAQMGMAYLKMGDPGNSEQMLRKSLAVSGDRYGDGFSMLATLLTNQQRFAEAAPLARKAIELDANMWQGHYELARALYGLNDLAGAQTSAAAAAELQPDNAETYLVLANIHTHLRDYPKLVDDLDSYLKLSPTGAQADQARQTRDQIRQVLAHAPGNARSPAPAATP